MKKIVKILLFLIFVTISLSHAQEFGAIKGIVTDEAGVPLPGANVTLNGSKIAPAAVMTSQGGHFRFLNLPVADDYVLKIEMPGFKTLIREKLVVSFGRDVILTIVLKQAVLQEEITVVGKTPVIDTKRTQVGVNVTDEMIMSLPTARNPWVIMALVPGMFIDREDVGGNEAGQQGWYVGHGVEMNESTWNLDGSYMYAGAAFAYVNLASYEELQINYGNNDIKSQTGGVQLNFISRRGGNRFSGMFYLDAERDAWQAENITPELEEAGYIAPGINRIYLYGAHFGGPIVKDRVWFYGSWGIQDLDVMTLVGTSDKTWITSGYFKLNFQLASRTKMELFLEYDNKQKWDIAYWGYTVQGPETYCNQEGPGYIWKGDLEHMFSNLYLNLKAVYFDSMAATTPVQGQRTPDGSGNYMIYEFYPDFYISGNYFEWKAVEDQLSVNFTGNYFAEGVLSADHEIKFGMDYVSQTATSFCYYEGNLKLAYWGAMPSFPTGEWWEAWLLRDFEAPVHFKRYSAYLQDTLTIGKLAVNLGLRYDWEHALVKDVNIPASPWLSQYMPAVKVDKIDPGVKSIFLSPRLSFTYDLTGDGKNVVKFSIARYGSQATNDPAYFINPIGSAEIDVIWQDLDGDSRVTSDELFGFDWSTFSLTSPDNPDYWLWYGDVNPEDPSDVTPLNKYDPDWKTPILDEVTLSYERELFSDFAVRFEFFYKKRHRESWGKGLMYVDDQPVIETKENYFLAGHDDTVDYDYYGQLEFFPYAYRTNHEKRFTRYLAGQIVLTKRLSNRWMLDCSFTYSDWSQYIKGEFLDPTFVPYYDGTMYAGGHTGKNLFGNTWTGLNSRWLFKLSGLYQAPLGINVSGVFTAREGFILPTHVSVFRPNIGWTALFGNPEGGGKFGDQRLPNFWVLNLRVEKVFQITETSTVALAADAFNVTNAAHSLDKESQIDSPDFGQDLKILNPRVFRFGVRYSF